MNKEKIIINSLITKLRKMNCNEEKNLTILSHYRFDLVNLNLTEEVERDLLKMINEKEKIIISNNNKKVFITNPSSHKNYQINIDKNLLENIKDKNEKTRSYKLKYTINGLINLLEDKNLVYNNLYTRNKIVRFLSKFKSFNGFKVSNININDLNRKFSFLSIKGNKKLNFTKLYFINNAIILNTILKDSIQLTIIYQYNSQLKSFISRGNNSYYQDIYNNPKFNIDCLNYREINKLSENDRIKYYSYLRSCLLHKNNRQLLKKIRRASYPFMDKKELLQELEAKIEAENASDEEKRKYKELKKANNLFYSNSLDDIKVDISEYYYY